MGKLRFQNPKKAKKERIDTLFKKACLLSRIFLHNPPKKGRIALLIEYDRKWQVFLSEENQKWPINFEKMQPAEVKFVKDIRTEKEAKEDLAMEKSLAIAGTDQPDQGFCSSGNETDSEATLVPPGVTVDATSELGTSPVEASHAEQCEISELLLLNNQDVHESIKPVSQGRMREPPVTRRTSAMQGLGKVLKHTVGGPTKRTPRVRRS